MFRGLAGVFKFEGPVLARCLFSVNCYGLLWAGSPSLPGVVLADVMFVCCVCVACRCIFVKRKCVEYIDVYVVFPVACDSATVSSERYGALKSKCSSQVRDRVELHLFLVAALAVVTAIIAEVGCFP